MVAISSHGHASIDLETPLFSLYQEACPWILIELYFKYPKNKIKERAMRPIDAPVLFAWDISPVCLGHLSCLSGTPVLFAYICPICLGHLSCLPGTSVLFAWDTCPVCLGYLSYLLGTPLLYALDIFPVCLGHLTCLPRTSVLFD